MSLATPKHTKNIPIIVGSAIGGAVVLGGVGLLARRHLRRKSTSDLAEADLTGAEWHAAVEFEDTNGATGA
jgi:hypothetical protein